MRRSSPILPTTTGPVLMPMRIWKSMPRCVLQLVAEALQRRLHAEGRAHGALRRVFVCDGRAEQRHDAVAGELIDRALVAVDLIAQDPEAAVHDAVDLLGVEAFAQCGEAADVGEQHA